MVVKTMIERESPSAYSCVEAFEDFRNGFNILILQAAAAVTVFVLYMAIVHDMSKTLMLHICFCTIGFTLLMTSAILLFAGDNIFGRPMTRNCKSIIHGITIGIGTAFALAGISIEINSRGDVWPHFSSTHAILGLTAMILIILACCGGFLACHIQIIRLAVPIIKPVCWKIMHNFIGLMAYIIGMCSFCYGFDTWWFNLVASHEQKVAVITVSAIITFWTALTPLVTLCGYLRAAFEC